MLNKKTILITAGPTSEFIDPVRILTNRSSGKLGFAFARLFLRKKRKVVLVTGTIPCSLKHKNLKTIHVFSAQEMFKVCKQYMPKCSILIMTAAVCDFKPLSSKTKKIKKTNSPFILKLKPNIDILKNLSKLKKKNQIFIGFALEDSFNLPHAIKKAKIKGMDYVILNTTNTIGSDFINAILLDSKGNQLLKVINVKKNLFAKKVIDKIPIV